MVKNSKPVCALLTVMITVTGSGFVDQSRVLLALEQRPTTYVLFEKPPPGEALRATLTDVDAAGSDAAPGDCRVPGASSQGGERRIR